ncbi:MAG TPA: Flp pilus assembly protein CpaB [Pirellulaceae bacterium]|nr:Flp pilus assembly protein CpaB [Pirellulaceae bacterium]
MKRISPATVTFTVMAIVLGLVAAYVIRQALEKPPVAKPAEPKPDPGVRVVFAAVNIPKNTRISESDVYTTHVPRDVKAATGSVRATPIAVGRITKQTIKAGQAMREEYLLGIGEALPDLAERLPEGMRAVAIDVVGAETGGKRLEEGDRVDISLTVEGAHPDLGEITTKTLLTDVLVVDASASRPRERTARRSVAPVIEGLTVAVSPEDANKLMVAQRTGILGVTLRSAMDAAKADDKAHEINRRELLGLREIPAPPAPRRYTIEKYSGGKLQVLEFDGDRVRESREGPSGKRFDSDEQPQAVTAPAASGDKSAANSSGVIAPVVASVEETTAN